MVLFWDELNLWERFFLDNVGRFGAALLAFTFLAWLGVF